MGKFDVISFGSATQDVFLSSQNFKTIDDDSFDTHKGLCVSLGSKMHMDSVFFAMGGVGTNTACTFAEQGLKTAYFGAVGKDAFGKEVKDELAKHGVSLDLLKESDEYPTAFSVILSLPEVGRSILEKYGACHELIEKDIPKSDLKSKWFYVGSLSSNSNQILVPILELAKEKGIKVSSNPAGSLKTPEHTELLRSVLDKIDILILNQEESAKLAGLDYKQEKEIFEKLDKLVDGIVVMTKGPEGVTVSDGEYMYTAGIPESGMVDRTGAGDAFGSAFTAGYIDKGDIAHAIQLGTANATSVLQEMGATNGLLKKGEWGEWPKVEVEKKKI
jgi:sugar/nucleoside kinase (ribokinase family)